MSYPSEEEFVTGYRDCLTPYQTRCLLQLWSKFFAACSIPPLPSTDLRRTNDTPSAAASDRPGTFASHRAKLRNQRLQAQAATNRVAGHQKESTAASSTSLAKRAQQPTNDVDDQDAQLASTLADPSLTPTITTTQPHATDTTIGAHLEGEDSLQLVDHEPSFATNGFENSARSRGVGSSLAPASKSQRPSTKGIDGSAAESGSETTGIPSSVSMPVGLEGEASGGINKDLPGVPLYTSSGPTKHAVEDYSSKVDQYFPRDDAAKDNLRLIEEAKEMRIFLDRYGGEKLRECFWRGMVKGEHPDAVMLRFLRSRKWDVERALNVIGSTARFRVE